MATGILTVVLKWAKLRKKLNKLKRGRVIAAVEGVAVTAAKELPKKLRADILANAMRVAPNADSTLAKKRGTVPLVDTEAYANSWSAVAVRKGNSVSVEMTAEGYEELALLMEAGTSHMPARPHLGPFVVKHRERLMREVTSEVLSVLGD